MHAEKLIILISLTILISYISSLVYSLTRIPDVIILMGFGILMGPVLGYADKVMFDDIAPLMSIIALSIILFDAGINVDITLLLGSMGKALVLSTASIMGSILLIGFVISYLLVPGLPFPQGMLLGAMVGGLALSLFTVSSAASLGSQERKKRCHRWSTPRACPLLSCPSCP